MIDLKSAKARSSITQMEARGYIGHRDLTSYSKAVKTNLKLLKDDNAMNRTIAAAMLKYRINKAEVCEALLLQLDRETALYTRMQICDTLASGDSTTARHLFKYLGKVGANQYNSLPSRISEKTSYPLPRDIVARTLGCMDKSILQPMMKELNKATVSEARELIDAVGYMCSKNDINKRLIYRHLSGYIEIHTDDVCRWKTLIAYGYLKPESLKELEKIASTTLNPIFKAEALKAIAK